MMPPREELLILVRQRLIEDFAEWFAENEDDDDSYTGVLEAMTNLSEMANFCQNAAWDIRQFVGAVLSALGFQVQDLDTSWLNEHAYGWDT